MDEEPSLPVSSAGSYDNKAFVHHETHQRQETRTTSSLYSETVAAEVETSSMMAANASRTTIPRHMVAVPIEPKFDVQMRVKRAPPPPASPLLSESDMASVALERNLTTILEREESSLTRSLESPPARMTTFCYVPELHGPPGAPSSTSTISRQQTPPVYSRILRKQAERETTSTSLLQERLPSPSPIEQPPLQHHEIRRPRSLTSLNTELTETRSLTEVTDHSHAKYRVANMLSPTPPPPPPIVPTSITTHTAMQLHEHRLYSEEMTEPLVEPQVVAPRRPEITTHEVDDVFLKTVTEKKTIEDIERHRRQVTEYRAKPQPPPPDPKWDVTIRNYPQENLPPPPPEWENFSDVSSTSNLTITNEPNGNQADGAADEEPDVNIEPTYTARAEIPCRPPPSARRPVDETDADWFSRLSRVLDPRYASELTDQERAKWREIITTDSTLRTLLTEAVVREDYELIRKDARYTNLFPPAKWDVIIRILGPPSTHPGSTTSSTHSKSHGQRYKRSKSSEWDTRSRRSSLPTLYEYESDGGSTSQDPRLHMSQSTAMMSQQNRLRRLGSSHKGAGGSSEVDVRSMSEMTVRDFVRADDLTSLSSFEGADSLVRSLSQPSLARSGSEFTEHWGIPSGMMDLPPWATEDADGTSSVETTPRVVRRNDRLEVLASFDDRRQATASSATRSSRYVERELSSVHVTESQRGSNWFHDDSEPEMQI